MSNRPDSDQRHQLSTVLHLPRDTIESKAWTLSLSPPVTLGGASVLRRQSYGEKEKWRILKNLTIMGFSFTLLFTAFMAMANLQSSIHNEGNLGLYSLACVYGAFLVSSLFVPPFLLARLKTKGTLLVSISGYIIYMVAQFYPKFETLIPASLFIGFCASGLWTSQGNYVTKIAEEYAVLKNLRSEIVSQWFFGFFFLCFHSSQIWGNLISSIILSGFKTNSDTAQQLNNTDETLNFDHCGANFCPAAGGKELKTMNGNKTVVDMSEKKAEVLQMQILTGIFVGCSILAGLVIFLGLDSLKRYGENEAKIMKTKWNSLLIATVAHWKNPTQLLLIPLATWMGIQEGFISGEFTVSYVTCGWGVQQIGFVMTAFGIAAATSSLLIGRMTEYVGRPIMFLTAAICNISCFITMLNWEPNPNEPHVFFIVTAIWGFADGVWSPQIRSLYGTIFKDTREAAFSNTCLWGSVGFIIIYLNATFVCMTIKIYIYLLILAIAMVGYFTVEFQTRKQKESLCW